MRDLKCCALPKSVVLHLLHHGVIEFRCDEGRGKNNTIRASYSKLLIYHFVVHNQYTVVKKIVIGDKVALFLV